MGRSPWHGRFMDRTPGSDSAADHERGSVRRVEYVQPALAAPKPRWRIPAMILVILLIAITWLELRTTPGPLAPPEGISTGTGLPADVGDRLSFGIESGVYQGGGTLVVDSIEPDRVPDGLRILGYGLLPPSHGGVGAVRSFPPGRVDLAPVDGAMVTNGEGIRIVVGVEPLERGIFVIPGFTVHYHSGIHRYAAHYDQAIVVCAPFGGGSSACR